MSTPIARLPQKSFFEKYFEYLIGMKKINLVFGARPIAILPQIRYNNINQ